MAFLHPTIEFPKWCERKPALRKAQQKQSSHNPRAAVVSWEKSHLRHPSPQHTHTPPSSSHNILQLLVCVCVCVGYDPRLKECFHSVCLFVCCLSGNHNVHPTHTHIHTALWIWLFVCSSYVLRCETTAVMAEWTASDHKSGPLCQSLMTAPQPLGQKNLTPHKFIFEQRNPSSLSKGCLCCDIFWYPKKFITSLFFSSYPGNWMKK